MVVKKSQEAKLKQQTDAEGNPLKPNQMEDDTPWAQLASLALFKLFTDWQAQGKPVPNELWRAPDGKDKDCSETEQKFSYVGMAKTQKPAKRLPENPTDRHPVQLLNELRGGVLFNLVSEVGSSPNISFTVGVDADGKRYTGEGKTKKEAKKNCAIEVLKQCHDIVFSNAELNGYDQEGPRIKKSTKKRRNKISSHLKADYIPYHPYFNNPFPPTNGMAYQSFISQEPEISSPYPNHSPYFMTHNLPMNLVKNNVASWN